MRNGGFVISMRDIKSGRIGRLLAQLSIGLAVAFAAGPLAASTLEAKKDGVTVTATADKAGAVLATLKSGETVDGTERKGMYWSVKTADGKAGFVSVMAVKVQAGASAVGGALQDAAKDGRNTSEAANVRSRSAVMGVRGLDESGETAFAGSARPDLRAVYAMEDFVIPQNRVEKLGEEVFAEIAGRAEAASK